MSVEYEGRVVLRFLDMSVELCISADGTDIPPTNLPLR